jgi:hypothetical protein
MPDPPPLWGLTLIGALTKVGVSSDDMYASNHAVHACMQLSDSF